MSRASCDAHIKQQNSRNVTVAWLLVLETVAGSSAIAWRIVLYVIWMLSQSTEK